MESESLARVKPIEISQSDVSWRDLKRKLTNYFWLGMLWVFCSMAIVPFMFVFFYVLIKGVEGLTWEFLTSLPAPVGELGGGMANAITGSGVLIVMAGLMGIPWGILLGLFMSEYSEGKTASVIRFCMDVLASIPSIVIGLFIYTLFVIPMKGFSAYAGAAALALIMLPLIARTTEEVAKLIPNLIREAGLGLGLARWKVVLKVVLPSCFSGVITGIILAIARVAGETAPLLFTSFNNQFWSTKLNQPMASLPVQIYTYAISPFEDWNRQAWAGALLLLIFVFVLNLLTRVVFARKPKGRT